MFLCEVTKQVLKNFEMKETHNKNGTNLFENNVNYVSFLQGVLENLSEICFLKSFLSFPPLFHSLRNKK